VRAALSRVRHTWVLVLVGIYLLVHHWWVNTAHLLRLACSADGLGGGGKKDMSGRAFEEPLQFLGIIFISFPWWYFGAVLLFLSISEKERHKKREMEG